jgi:hypothetical protein
MIRVKCLYENRHLITNVHFIVESDQAVINLDQEVDKKDEGYNHGQDPRQLGGQNRPPLNGAG